MTFTIALLLPLLIIWGFLVVESYKSRKRDLTLSANSPDSLPENPPLVTILVPVRNEEKNIAACLDALLNQDYPNFEIIVINDRSTDSTQQIAEKYAAEGRIKLIRVSSLPPNWTGKNYALHTGVAEAKGEWLLFVDADTRLAPFCLRKLMSHVLAEGVDLLSLLGTMDSRSFYEKMLVPTLGATLMLWFPPRFVNDRKWKVSFANGQCLLISRDAYRRCGGHEAVRHELLEDIAMAKKVKDMGGNVHIALAPELYRARMYDRFSSLFRGWSRIYAAGIKSAWKIAVHILATLYMSIFPFVCLCWSLVLLLMGERAALPILALSAVVCCLVIWAVSRTYWVSGTKKRFALLHPISCVVVVLILTHALVKLVFGGSIVWRDTAYPTS